MIAVIIRWFSPLLICLALTGCSLPLQNESSTEETEYFAHGLDQYIASGDLTFLKRLPQQYPQGEWRTKAEGLVGKIEQHQARLKENERELEHAQKEQATLAQNNQVREATLEQEKATLVKDNQELKVTLEKLKQVLIDMEQKTK